MKTSNTHNTTNEEKHAAKLQALSAHSADRRDLMRKTLLSIDTDTASVSTERRMLLQSSDQGATSSASQSLASRVRIFAPLAVVTLVVLGGVMVLRRPTQSPSSSTGTSLTASQIEPNGTAENTINSTLSKSLPMARVQ